MYVSSGQIYYFLACLVFGFLGGLIYSIKNLLFNSKNKSVSIIIDVLYFLFLLLLYVLYSYVFNFPNVRVYMILGVLTGIILCVESFGYILAKFIKRRYNINVETNVNRKGMYNDRGKG